MDERQLAIRMIQQLSGEERNALEGLVSGESVGTLSHRMSVSLARAIEIREALNRKLGVRSNAEAVRIGLIAGLP